MLISALLLFVSCGERTSTTVDLTQFEQSCSVNDDCAVVFTGDTCNCSCETTGINVSEMEDYNLAWDESFAGCDEVLECVACPNSEAFCDEGTCSAREIDWDADIGGE